MNHHQIRDFPGRERSDFIQLAKKFRAIRRGDVDGLDNGQFNRRFGQY